jgi:biofilm PGA synthesis lipoprotein PgaB
VAGTATARQGVDIIDAQLLRRLLERVNLASPSVLVDTRLERPALSLERKPTRKLLPRVAFGQD